MPWQSKQNLLMFNRTGYFDIEGAMDREDKFFFLSLISLAVSLFLFPLALYLLPKVWLGWVYHTPDFTVMFGEYFQASWGMPQETAQWLVVNIFFVLGAISAWVAYYAARQVRIDHKKHLPQEKVDEAQVRLKQTKQGLREIMLLLVKLAVIVFLVVIISNIVQWGMGAATQGAG
jgi:hypothetical protein